MRSNNHSGRTLRRATAPDRFEMCLDLRSGDRSLGVARDRLGDWLADTAASDTAYWEILTAAGEACANAFEHSGTDVSSDCPAWIEAWMNGSEVHLVVGDRGRWSEPDPAGLASGRRGRGRMLMAGLMDTMSIRSGPEGTVVEMSKVIPRLDRHLSVAGVGPRSGSFRTHARVG